MADIVDHRQPTPAPVLVRWLCGIALVDLDQRAVWWWSGQCSAYSALRWRLLEPLLAAAWPGWTLRWMLHPAAEIAALLPDHDLSEALRAPLPLSLDDFRATQEAAWQEGRASLSNLDDLLAECGEAEVRSWFEGLSHQSIACILDPAGRVREVTFDDGWDTSLLLRAGPEALAVLQQRPPASLEDIGAASLASVYWIVPETRTLEGWFRRPVWADHGLSGAEARWPGWRLQTLEGGAFTVQQRLGRPLRSLLSPEAPADLQDMLQRLEVKRDAAAVWALLQVGAQEIGEEG